MYVAVAARDDDDDGALCKLSGVICKSHNSHMGGFIETYMAVYCGFMVWGHSSDF